MGLREFASNWLSGPSKNPYPGQLSDEAWELYRREKLGGSLRDLGDYLTRGAYGDFTGGQAQGGGLRSLQQFMQAERMLEEQQSRDAARQKDRAQTAAQRALGAGNRFDPSTSILWDQPPAAGREPAPATQEQRRDLLSQAYPGAYGKAMMAQEFQAPVERFETVQDPYGLGGVGQRSTTTGRISDYQKKPAAPEYNAPMTVLDENGKPMLIRVPKGAGAPVPLGGGYRPYEKPAGRTGTALMQNVGFLEQKLGMTTREAVDLLQQSKTKSREEMVFTMASRLMTGYATLDREEAKQEAESLYDTIFSPESLVEPAPAPQPTNPGILERARDVIEGFLNPATEVEAGTQAPDIPRPATQPTPPRPTGPAAPSAPRGMGLAGPGPVARPPVPPATAEPEPSKPIETMTVLEIADLIHSRGDSLSPEQLRLVDERLKALGR